MASLERWMAVVGLRLRSLVGRDAVDRDLDDELRDHLERATEAGIAQGLSPAEARRLAIVSMGGVEGRREECREARGLTIVWSVAQDLRFASRMLRRRPIFSLAAIVTLALAIGANVSIFGLIDRVLLHPLDVPEPARLLSVRRTVQRAGVSTPVTSMSWDQASRIAALSTLDAAVSSARTDRATRRLEVTLPRGDITDAVDVQFVSADYFQVLGLSPALGRSISAGDDAAGAPPVALLGYRYWRSRFGGRPDVLGRTIHINGTPTVVVGVVPRTFTGTDLTAAPPDLVLPLLTAAQLAANPSGMQTDGRGRFSSNPRAGEAVSPGSPIADFVLVARRIRGEAVEGAQNELTARLGAGWTLVPIVETMVPFASRSELRRFLGLLAGAVGLTLLIGCANLAGLLLARSEERRSEFAVRLALGAGRGRLVQSLVVEAGLLALAGGAAGLLVAGWIDQRLSAFVLPGGVAVSSLRPGIDIRTLSAALLSTVAVSVVISMAPAWHVASRRAAFDLKARRAGSDRLGAMRVFAAVQVAVCVVLVFGAALFVRRSCCGPVRRPGLRWPGLALGVHCRPPSAARHRSAGRESPRGSHPRAARRCGGDDGAAPAGTAE